MTIAPRRIARHDAVRRLAYLALCIAIFAAGYYGAQHGTRHAVGWDSATAFDRALPCAPGFAWVYLIGVLLPALPAIAMPPQLLARTAGAFALLIAMAALVFWLAPSDGAALRAQCGADVAWPLREIQRLDAPRNQFPSLHIGLAVLTALCLRRVGRRWFLPVALLAGIEPVAVCLVKQHSLADAVAGAALGGVAYAVAFARGAGRGSGSSIQP